MFKEMHLFLVVLLVLCGYAVQSERRDKCRELYSTITSTPPSSRSSAEKDLGYGKVSTAPGEFPFMVALGWKSEEADGYEFYCGGILIAPEYVLSTAHCTNNIRRVPPQVVRIGRGSLSESAVENISIVEIIPHPEYKHSKFYNDISIVKIAAPSSQTPVCLWQSPDINQTEVTAIGYGKTSFEGGLSSDLLKVKLDIVPNDVCRTQLKPMRRLEEGIIDSQVCAGDESKTRDICDEDGPFLVKIKDNDKEIPYVVGIISFGRNCAAGTPTVSTRVSSYLEWIESIVWP